MSMELPSVDTMDLAAHERFRLHELFKLQARRHPGRVAAVCNGEELTYAELDRRADELARRLRACGARLETLVGLCVRRSLHLLTGILGIWKAGGAYVPMDPDHPRERLRSILSDTGLTAVVTQNNLRGLFTAEGLCIIAIDDDRHESGGGESVEFKTAVDPLN